MHNLGCHKECQRGVKVGTGSIVLVTWRWATTSLVKFRMVVVEWWVGSALNPHLAAGYFLNGNRRTALQIGNPNKLRQTMGFDNLIVN
jgi:hypothetical protein